MKLWRFEYFQIDVWNIYFFIHIRTNSYHPGHLVSSDLKRYAIADIASSYHAFYYPFEFLFTTYVIDLFHSSLITKSGCRLVNRTLRELSKSELRNAQSWGQIIKNLKKAVPHRSSRYIKRGNAFQTRI